MNKYDLSGEYGVGYTKNGEPFYFDLEDFEKIKNYTWYIDTRGYVKTSNPDFRMHRVVLGITNREIMVDHIFHKKYDNRKSQLRIVTNSQNQMNRGVPSQNVTGFRGVSWHKQRNAWIAQIGLNGKLKYIGIFKKFDDAVNARIKAENTYFGEYNFRT